MRMRRGYGIMASFVFMLVTFILVGGVLGDLYVRYDGHLWSNMKTSYKVCLCGYALLLFLVLANGMLVDSVILLGAGALAFWLGARMAQNRMGGAADDAEDSGSADGSDTGWTLPVSVAERYESRKTVLDNDDPAEEEKQS